MKHNALPELPDTISPAGADVRLVLNGRRGSVIHSTVKPGQINQATVHKTVDEIWFVLEGRGEIWRRQDGVEQLVELVAGMAIDIPAGTAFQYRNTGEHPLKFICVTMPPWPGADEAVYVDGIWTATIGASRRGQV